jgi:aspartyl/asparaginyl beta-hydroxylase (cupin superfamily)
VIAGRRVDLREGRAFVFDDSFVHTAWNESDRPRFVLYFDFFHPDLTPQEVWALKQYYEDLVVRPAAPERRQAAERSPDWVYG